VKGAAMGSEIFAEAELNPSVASAGDSNEFTIRLMVGGDYTKGASRIIFDFPATLGMSRPTRMHREHDGFVDVYVSNADVTYSGNVWEMKLGHFVDRDHKGERGARLFILDLSGGLKKGDIIELRWGETTRGYGAGAKVSTVVPLPNYDTVIHIRYFDDPEQGLPDRGRSFKGYDRPVPKCEIPLKLKVLPRDPHRLRVIRKTDKAMLVPLDVFWNVCDVKDASELVDADQNPSRNSLGVFEYRDKNIRVHAKKLPLLESADMEDVFDGLNIYWGDIHTHSCLSNDCIEREKLQMRPDDLMRFAQARAGLDFFSITDHHQPWDTENNKIGKPGWDETMEAVQAHNKPGQFVAFSGFEFRGPRGDTVVTLGWDPPYGEIDRPEWTNIRKLWEALSGKNYMTAPHFHAQGKLQSGEWWDSIDDGVETVLEIFSCHGNYEREDALEHARSVSKSFRPDRSVPYFLSKGYRYGLVCNSDGHKGHVGSNGVTGVFARKLDRDAILQAHRRRHVYGTTNARIRLVFTACGQLMGSVVPNAPEKAFLIDVVGENRLKKVDLIRNGEPFKRLVPVGKDFKTELTVRDEEASNWYVRVTQMDNQIAWSSPIWFE
jgi:hypothetical protein